MSFDLTPPDSARARAERTAGALFRLHERFATAPGARERLQNPYAVTPHDAVRLTTALAAGSLTPMDAEPHVDQVDLLAALTLVPQARSDMDDLEISLVQMARAGGMTWAQLGFALGLGSAQAAQQRHERMVRRATEDPSD